MKKMILKTSLGAIIFLMALFLFSYSAQANTWTQVNEDGFGDNNTSNTGSLAVFDGYIYAGASNSRIGIQIWRTNDGTNWAKVNENGFGDTSNSGSYAMAAYGGYLYVSTYNYEGGAKIWRTNDGTAWTQVIGDELDLNDEGYDENGFGSYYANSIYALTEFQGYLYAATNGAEIYRTNDGTSWTPVVASSIDADYVGSDERGFGGGNESIYELTNFDGYLYAGTYSYYSYFGYHDSEIWRSSDGTSWSPIVANEIDDNDEGFDENGFGDSSNSIIYSLTSFGGYLYAGTSNNAGGEIWRSNNGTDWGAVVDNDIDIDEIGVEENGFGNDSNDAIYAMQELDGYLYAGTYNANSGTVQIWRSNDGTTWEKSNEDGFGDSDNVIASSMTVFNDQLYVGTSNSDSGTEIWGYLDSTAPAVANQSPADKAQDVSLSSNIYFEADDSDSGINSNSVDVKIGDSVAVADGSCQSGYTCTIELDGSNGYNITIDPSSDFSPNNEQTIIANVSDFGGNAVESSWTFKTEIALNPKIITTSGPGEPARLQAYDRRGEAEGSVVTGLFPTTYTGGAGIVPIDQSNNGAQDQFLIFAINNGGPQARVLGLREDGSTVVKGQQFVFDSSLRDGLSATSGDFDNDGFQDDAAFCLTGDRAPIVRVYTDVTGVDSWKLAYEFRAPFGNVGCNLGTFQYDENQEEILVTPNHGPADPNVYIYWANGTLQKQFVAYGAGVQSGLTPSGIGDRIYTTPNNGSSQINGFDKTGERKSFWWAYEKHVRGDFKNVPGDVDLDGKDELLISPIGSNGPQVLAFEPTGSWRTWPNFFAFGDKTLRNGVGIAVIDNYHGVN